MAKTCTACKRKPLNTATRSHSNIKTKKRQRINLQSTVYHGKKIDVCTSCLKNLYK